MGWWLKARLSLAPASDDRLYSFVIKIVFGMTVVAMWEIQVRMLDISTVILPSPSVIANRFASSLNILWADFVQTIVKGALTG